MKRFEFRTEYRFVCCGNWSARALVNGVVVIQEDGFVSEVAVIRFLDRVVSGFKAKYAARVGS